MQCLNPYIILNPQKYPTNAKYQRYVALGISKQYLAESKEMSDYIAVPCGKCPACQLNKREQWAVRLECEYLTTPSACYVATLTYDNEHLPAGGRVSKRDCQLFFKRLRHDMKCRYFLSSEYGTNKGRPHYHCIIFTSEPNLLKVTKLINKHWKLGNCYVDRGSESGIRYTIKYIIKDIFDNDVPSNYKPFYLYSKGLGASVLDTEYIKSISDLELPYFPVHDNGKVYYKMIPKSWKKKIFTDAQRQKFGQNMPSEVPSKAVYDAVKRKLTKNQK